MGFKCEQQSPDQVVYGEFDEGLCSHYFYKIHRTGSKRTPVTRITLCTIITPRIWTAHYHTVPKIIENPFYYGLMCQELLDEWLDFEMWHLMWVCTVYCPFE